MKNCHGLTGYLLGHKFQARYSLSQPAPFENTWHPAWGPDHSAKLAEAAKAKTYHHDICTRCGYVVPTNAEDSDKSGDKA